MTTEVFWQNNHRPLLMQDAKRSGYEFSENIRILFEDFKVVFSI